MFTVWTHVCVRVSYHCTIIVIIIIIIYTEIPQVKYHLFSSRPLIDSVFKLYDASACELHEIIVDKSLNLNSIQENKNKIGNMFFFGFQQV